MDDDRHGQRLKNELIAHMGTDPTLIDFLDEACLDGLWFWDITDPAHEWLSPRFKALFGYEDHEIPNNSLWWQENIHPEDLKTTITNYRLHCEDASHPYDQVVRYKHKDGSTVWVRCRGLALRDAVGRPIRMLGAHTDLTPLYQELEKSRVLNSALNDTTAKLRQREAALEKAAKSAAGRFRRIFETSPMGEVIVTRDGQIQDCNPALTSMLGWNLTQLQGIGLSSALGAAVAAKVMSLPPGLPPNSPPQILRELCLLTQWGEEIFVDLHLNPLSAHEQGEILLTFTNITERVRLMRSGQLATQKLALLNEDLSHFTRAVAHDLQTPLRGVRNLANWIQDDIEAGNAEEVARNMARLDDQVERMQRLIIGLLRYAADDTQGRRVESVDLHELVMSEWAILSPPEGFAIDASESLPAVTTVRTPLSRCLRNLLDNAVKHHDKTQGLIRVTAETFNGWLTLTVEDDGPGIPQEYQKQVFGFLKTLSPTSENSGPGLGLATVARMVRGLGGEVGVKSDGERGCQFWFTWPLQWQSHTHVPGPKGEHPANRQTKPRETPPLASSS